MIKQILKLWNDNFNKGVSIFQICLMGSMIIGWIIGSNTLILFSMTACLFGYFEPTEDRFSIRSKR
jgi:hypothetical protein